jgi:hypothetical protein
MTLLQKPHPVALPRRIVVCHKFETKADSECDKVSQYKRNELSTY